MREGGGFWVGCAALAGSLAALAQGGLAAREAGRSARESADRTDRVERIREEFLGALDALRTREAAVGLPRAEALAPPCEGEVAPPSASRLERDLLLPTVRLSCGGAFASGTVIGCVREPGGVSVARILTAAHAVADAQRSEIRVSLFGPGQEVVEEALAMRLASCEAIDIALLEARLAVPAFPARWGGAPAEAVLLDEVWAVGCPLGVVPVPTAGRIVCTNRRVDGEVFWMFSAQTIFGNSGGGVYAADTRRLVGIARGVCGYGADGASAVPHLGVLVPAGRIASWLEETGYGGLPGEVRPTSFRPGDAAR